MGDDLAKLSRHIDAANQHRDPEAITWGRLAKVPEECGEVIAAYIGVTGQNPRKGVTHTRADVCKELLDVAVTALAAYEHMTGDLGYSPHALARHVRSLLARVGLA
jgi:hypothetical protein